MLIDASSAAGRAARLVESAPGLAALGLERRARSLAAAAERLLSVGRGRAHLERLAQSSGLDEAMVRWALETTLETARADVLLRLGEAALGAAGPGARPVPARLSAVILSANVFTAPLRALFIPLLVGVPVFAKASAREAVFPGLLGRALAATDPELGASLDVITAEGHSPVVDAILDQADVVSVYGSDATTEAVRARAPASVPVIALGHGLGLDYIDALPADGPAMDALARAIAVDVAAYDQRGCLSPHAAFVRGDAGDAARLADALPRALGELARERPRGALETFAAATQIQWRGVAAARGRLLEGNGFSVSDEGAQALRLGPGYRNVAIHTAASLEAFAARVAPLGVHLKALGFHGGAPALEALARALPAPLAPRISPVGAMQTPPFDALADGALPYAGLLRFLEG
jgi:hypothetical protein